MRKNSKPVGGFFSIFIYLSFKNIIIYFYELSCFAGIDVRALYVCTVLVEVRENIISPGTVVM